MKRLILASSALALMSASAFAADLPARTMAPAPAPFVSAPMFTWTGFYVGVNAGWTRNDTEAKDRGFTGVVGSYPTINLGGRNDFIGGAQVGYNQQFGMFVGGIEADINYLGDRSSSAAVAVAGLGGFGITTATARSSLDWLGTVRLRAGVAFDRALIYGTGGLALGSPNQTLTISGPGGVTHFGSDDEMKAGWTLGAGAEYAFTDNLTMKAEYLYYDLGSTTVTAAPRVGFVGTSNSARFENNGHIARVGLNYKF